MIGKLFKLTFALLGAGITYFIYQMAFKFPQIVEVVYSRGIYPFFTKTIGRLSAALPFSLAEVLLYLFLISILFFIGYIFSAFFKPRGEKLIHIGKRLLSFISLLCSLYTMFILFWGINYARMPLADSMGLSTEAGYTVSDLQALCQDLIEECNTLRDQVEEDEQGVYRLSHTKQAVMESMYNLYNTYAPAWMNLAGQSVVKGVATPNLLSYTETSGIYSPFTFEANINMQMPDLYFAATAAHEYAHLQGFAREDEANFISWYLLSQSEEADLAYSGNLNALHYALNALYKADSKAYAQVAADIGEGVKRDFAAHSQYWETFDTKLSEVSDKIYESYLDSNGVSDGLQSYGRMLDLMLALRQQSA